ncbi:D-alanyl-D-alanine carboxypeptidase family protein [Paeniroseomonas aquatica]|uniref:serine-type D-Ala-D-Ala carboxypeptidase n=1 Tax=Paeniroseomonas aquatica TaxID=373043 RepID=A0ABT8A3R6_9PROT|nr:D-alanyl-D-alanine carboxypeptidase family protein [Paeniroseomonas aquatica]MDN3564369.1 D-alanyl-D-alanine carboxypeptidase family protein [Paeniroseomonas aquatica]
MPSRPVLPGPSLPGSNARGAGRRSLLLPAAAALTTASLPLGASAQAQPRPAGPRPSGPRTPAGPTPTPASTPLGPFDTIARQALIRDADTGEILLSKNADERMPPSSMSKLMTMYMVFSMLKAGRLKLDQELPVSERAWRMQGSKMFVQLGNSIPVESLIRGVIVQSGNDACVVLAEGISGSEQQFAEAMNVKAREIGLTNSNFRNATGWPDPEHRMTCADLATLAQRIINDFPDYYKYYNERSFTWNGISQDNRNPALLKVPGADGLKTGHTEEAGYGLTASAKRGDRRLILVFNGLPSMRARAEESERLLEWGFREFENVVLFRAAEVVQEVPVHLGERPTVPLVGGRDLVVTMPKAWRQRMQVRLRYDQPVAAPVAKGQKLGALVVSGQGMQGAEHELFAGADVERLGLLPRIPAVIGRWFAGS